MTDVLAHGAQSGLSGSAWVAVVLLGVFHGVNPGMGWLFAVSYGLQERTGARCCEPFRPSPWATNCRWLRWRSPWRCSPRR